MRLPSTVFFQQTFLSLAAEIVFLKPSAYQVNMNVIDGEWVVGLTGGGSGWFGGSPSTNHLCNQDGGRR